MSIYIKVQDGSKGSYFIGTFEEAVEMLDQECENLKDDGECNGYIFEPVEMTDEEYRKLPEFQGF